MSQPRFWPVTRILYRSSPQAIPLGPGKRVQLYHRLRGRQTVGLVAQRRRNDHTVPASRVIPYLTW